MGDVTTRHIRKDWASWVDWPGQKTVTTMCGVRSTPRLCGIPGITEQKTTVEKNNGRVWGWCMNCVRSTFPYLLHEGLTTDVTTKEIINLHRAAREAIKKQYVSNLRREAHYAQREGRFSAYDLIRDEIERLITE